MAKQEQAQLQLDATLKRAIAATEALCTWHARQHTHGGLHPQAFVEGADGQLQLLPPPDEPTLSLHRLRYASPEQAGRLAPTGVRSDLYSLGLLLYEWFAGQPAFASEDALELAYRHICVLPSDPQTHAPALPRPLSDLVMRLLAKSPLARYASAQGLLDDLRFCLQQWRRNGRIDPFTLGSTDTHAQLAPPDRLYGRGQDLARLKHLWKRATEGEVQVCWLAGATGMGKSTLAHALQPLVLQSGGQVAEGRFATRGPAQDYSALLQACRSLLLPLQSATEAERRGWCERLQQTLGAHLPVLLQALPDMEWLTGPQLAPSLAVGLAAQQRLHEALLALLLAFARPGQALLLLLDDMHAADAASLALLRALLQAPAAGHLLLLVTYDPKAVGANHPLARLQQQLQGGSTPETLLALQPLDLHAVVCLVDDSCLRLRPLNELSAHVQRKSQGNPGRVWQLLQQWVVQGQLQFDADCDGWRWRGIALGTEEMPQQGSSWWA